MECSNLFIITDMLQTVSTVEVAGIEEAGVDTATHFSFLPSSFTAPSLSDSSSDVTLSSVSASTPVLFSDSELDDSLEETSILVGPGVEDSVVATSDDSEIDKSLFAAVSARAFLALERASLRSIFYINVR